MDYHFIESEYDKKEVGVWTDIGHSKIAYQLYFKGACCDMPMIENMRAEIKNDTLFIESGIPVHQAHDKTGICAISIDFVMKKDEYPRYKNLTVSLTRGKK
jgi:hypothetical protein